MDEQSHKNLIKRFYEEVWNKGNLAVADEVLAPDYVRHDLRPGNPAGPEGMKKIASDQRVAFPDLHLAVTFMVAEDDMVVARWVTTGTHKGKWGNVEPTGRHVEYSGVNIWRFSRGKVVELWNYRDDLGLMQQLGAPMHGEQWTEYDYLESVESRCTAMFSSWVTRPGDGRRRSPYLRTRSDWRCEAYVRRWDNSRPVNLATLRPLFRLWV